MISTASFTSHVRREQVAMSSNLEFHGASMRNGKTQIHSVCHVENDEDNTAAWFERLVIHGIFDVRDAVYCRDQ